MAFTGCTEDEGVEVAAGSSPEGGLTGWRALLEIGVVVGLYLLYTQVRLAVRHQEPEAFDNAAEVVQIERALGIFTELDLQRLALHNEIVVRVLDRYYATVHFPLTAIVLAWAFLRHRATSYALLRFLLISVTLVAMGLHALYPLAPPRMLDHLGFVDTLAVYGPQVYSADTAQSVANQFAAMPSLHVGWAAIIAWWAVRTFRSPWRHLVWLHPAFTLIAVTATANHYWLDSVIALLLVIAAASSWHALDARRLLPSDHSTALAWNDRTWDRGP